VRRNARNHPRKRIGCAPVILPCRLLTQARTEFSESVFADECTRPRGLSNTLKRQPQLWRSKVRALSHQFPLPRRRIQHVRHVAYAMRNRTRTAMTMVQGDMGKRARPAGPCV
jgi:hypothetical protein